MDSERELALSDYLSIVKRKFPYVVVFFFLAFFAVIAIALWIPPVYQATATILIESQQVKPDQAKEKYAADRFAALNQVVLSKDNLLKIIERYKLYGLDKKPDISREILINAIRGNVSVEAQSRA